MKPTILSCAVTGNFTTRDHNPNLPITPEEIAGAAIGAAKAGAAIVHIHVRYPDTGLPSMELEHYRAVVEKIRASDTDLIINLTTGPGGRFIPGEEDPSIAGPGTNFKTPEYRTEHIVELKPEICSLDLNTMWFATSAVINSPRNVKIMAERIYAAGVRPEIEVFDTGDIHLANSLVKEGALKAPLLFQIVTGIQFGMSSSPDTISYAKSLLPEGSEWAAFGIGRMEFPMVAQAWLHGGHTRVGMEDNVYLEKGVLTPDNAALVTKAVRIIEDLGGQVATVSEARQMLGLG
jgi:uncharacterized protein (DUF849 family)